MFLQQGGCLCGRDRNTGPTDRKPATLLPIKGRRRCKLKQTEGAGDLLVRSVAGVSSGLPLLAMCMQLLGVRLLVEQLLLQLCLQLLLVHDLVQVVLHLLVVLSCLVLLTMVGEAVVHAEVEVGMSQHRVCRATWRRGGVLLLVKQKSNLLLLVEVVLLLVVLVVLLLLLVGLMVVVLLLLCLQLLLELLLQELELGAGTGVLSLCCKSRVWLIASCPGACECVKP